MDITIKWHKPKKLIDGSSDSLIFKVSNLEDLDSLSGVYMFCRQYDGILSPLYIGQAKNIGSRIKQQLNTTKLMKGIEKSQKGNKVLVAGEIIPKSGQDIGKCITIIEHALIEHALANGYSLLNIQGTKTPTHQLNFTGYASAKKFTGKAMNVAIKKKGKQ